MIPILFRYFEPIFVLDVHHISSMIKWVISGLWLLDCTVIVCCPPWTSVCRLAAVMQTSHWPIRSQYCPHWPIRDQDSELQSGVSALLLLQCCIPSLKSAETCSSPLIGQHWSRDLDTGLWLVNSNLDTGLWLVDAQTLMDIMISQSREECLGLFSSFPCEMK